MAFQRPTQAVDPSKLKHYQELFKKFGITITVHEHSLARFTHWRMEQPLVGWSLTTGFDIDLDRALQQLEKRVPPERIDLTFHAKPTPTARTSGLTDGPRCVICGEFGGLPCPAMVKEALTTRFVLAVPLDSPDVTQHKHVHPGRCRKRLRSHLDAAHQQRKLS